MLLRMVALGILIVFSACQSPIEASDLPAVLEKSSASSHAELVQAVSDALHGSDVILADDVLTKSSSLTIERKERRDLQGRRGTGRMTDPPDHFELVINATDCVLIHLRDKSRTVLKKATCKIRQ